MKEYTYNTSYSFIGKDGKRIRGTTTLSKNGVLLTIRRPDEVYDMLLHPSGMAEVIQDLRDLKKDGVISALVLGKELTVIEDEGGFYIKKPQKLYL